MKLFGRFTPRSVAAAALVMLTACSVEDHAPPAPEDVTLEFPLPEVEPRERWRIEIPPGLQEVAQADGTVLVTGVEVQGRELEEFTCAMELTLDYASGSKDAERLAQPTPSEAEGKASLERHREQFFESFGVATAEEFDEKYRDETPVSDTGYGESLQEYWAEDRYETWAEVRQAYFAELEAEIKQEVEEAARSSDIENVGQNLGFYSPQPLSALDESSPESGPYISDDYRTVVVVQSCASVPSDSEEDYPAFESYRMWFPFDEDGREGISAIASVDLTVVSGGKVAVPGGDVRGWSKGFGDTWERGTQ